MQYGLVHHYWRGSPTVDVSLVGTEAHVKIPVDFLEKSGDNTWAFVLRLLKHMVVEDGFLSPSAPAGQACSSLQLTSAPVAGAYQFCITCPSTVQDTPKNVQLTCPP